MDYLMNNVPSAEIYTIYSTSGQASSAPAGNMVEPRSNPIVCPVNGGAIILGGTSNSTNTPFPATVEFWSSTQLTFTKVGSITDRVGYSATALPDGRILIVGGSRKSDNTVLDTLAIFDPATGAFGDSGLKVHQARMTPTLTWSGSKLFITGGYSSMDAISGRIVASQAVDILDTNSMTITTGSNLVTPRNKHAVVSDVIGEQAGLSFTNKNYILGGARDSYVTTASVETMDLGGAGAAAFGSRLAIPRQNSIGFVGPTGDLHSFGFEISDVSASTPVWIRESGLVDASTSRYAACPIANLTEYMASDNVIIESAFPLVWTVSDPGSPGVPGADTYVTVVPNAHDPGGVASYTLHVPDAPLWCDNTGVPHKVIVTASLAGRTSGSRPIWTFTIMVPTYSYNPPPM
jgi:hypothetical protein